MRVLLAVEFRQRGVRGVTMSEWAKRAAKRLYEREHKDEIANAAMLEKRRLLQEHGPSLWFDLCATVSEMCDDLNAELGREAAVIVQPPSSELRVQLTNGEGMSEMIASFRLEAAPDALQWRYAGPAARRSGGGTYAVIIENGAAVLGDGHDRTTPETVATFMMEGLLP